MRGTGEGIGGTGMGGPGISNRLRKGMAVRSSDGEHIGKITRLDADTVTVEKGYFLKNDYVVRYEAIATVSHEEVTLLLDEAALERSR